MLALVSLARYPIEAFFKQKILIFRFNFSLNKILVAVSGATKMAKRALASPSPQPNHLENLNQNLEMFCN